MALVKTNLVTEIRKINDKEFSSFGGFPEDIPESANRWSVAVNIYASKVTPISTTAEQARAAFETVMLGVNVEIGNGLILFNSALVAYAGALALGMTGAGFVGVPPPVPPDISPIEAIGLGGGSSEAVAELMSTIIDLWFKTGTATPISGGASIPWS